VPETPTTTKEERKSKREGGRNLRELQEGGGVHVQTPKEKNHSETTRGCAEKATGGGTLGKPQEMSEKEKKRMDTEKGGKRRVGGEKKKPGEGTGGETGVEKRTEGFKG